MSGEGAALRPRVLLVDDEPNVTEGLRIGLRAAPYEIETANSAAEALARVDAGGIDAVVSDEYMPDVSGVELLAEIRRRRPEIARMILTGRPTLATATSAINRAGVSRYLIKPCAPEEIAACLDQALRARRALEREPTPAAELDLDRALERIRMVYQPIVAAGERRLYGYEALLRCDLPGVESPLTVLDAAEAQGRLDELNLHVLELVARDCAAHPDRVCFVNLTPQTLESPWLFGPENPLWQRPRHFVLEVTERSMLRDVSDLAQRTQALRQEGFRIAVDDLGAGYAGLSSLALLEPDIVKLDRDLVQDLDSLPTRHKLVRSMIELCRELGMLSLGEGVETRAERDALVALGVDLLQGYHLGRPLKPWSGFHWE